MWFSGASWDSKSWSRRDMKEFYDDYPTNRNDLTLNDNVLFYTNQISQRPEKAKIDDVHAQWFGKHEFLEYCHSYIQWLFPIQESGLNPSAQVLQKHEIATMKADPTVILRVKKSFQLMLDFYGWDFDITSESITRSAHWEECFENLSFSSHNWLRVTRILKHLSEMGLEHLGEKWLSAVQDEIYTTKALHRCQKSFEDYWINAFRDSSVTTRLDARAKALCEGGLKGESSPVPVAAKKQVEDAPESAAMAHAAPANTVEPTSTEMQEPKENAEDEPK